MKNEINFVFKKLQEREMNPHGCFDNGGRFYICDDDLVNVRTPSRAFPYSQLIAGRTKKFVTKVVEKYQIKNIEELLKHFDLVKSKEELLKEFEQNKNS